MILSRHLVRHAFLSGGPPSDKTRNQRFTTMSFPCLMVRRNADGNVACRAETITLEDLPPGDVLIEVVCSSLNYKDALACQGHPGVARKLPHVPGIDCSGQVVESASPQFRAGDNVLVTGYGLGSDSWGGYSQYVRVPADWVVALPEGLTHDVAMTYGTAGFTAAQCVSALQHHGIEPDRGEVVVTGATGGVGSLAIAILAKLGYQVVAVTGKPAQASLLEQLGACRVISREEVDDSSTKPLLAPRWAGAIDTVGGNTLATLLRGTEHRGCVTACGLVAGHILPTTVFPFILRGVTLAGIDSAQCPREPRLAIWQHLAGDWHVDHFGPLAREITLADVPREADAMLAGKTWGRALVRPTV